jgi:hypothetical protein
MYHICIFIFNDPDDKNSSFHASLTHPCDVPFFPNKNNIIKTTPSPPLISTTCASDGVIYQSLDRKN